MIHKVHVFAAAALALAISLPAVLFAADPIPAYITAAVNSMARDNDEKVRDKDSKPGEIMAFSEVKPGSVVVDLNPGFGYWTKLFSKAVGPQGHVYPVIPIRGARTYAQERAVLEKAAAAAGRPAPNDPLKTALAIQFVTDYKNVKAIAISIDWFHGNFGIPEQADLISNATGYNSFHNKVPGDNPVFMDPYNMTEINRAIYRAMKPGAVYMISDFASAPGAGFSVTESLNRADPEAVKAEVTSVGFEYVGSSDARANPTDDHNKVPNGGGTPDRYILKFRKPRNAPIFDKRPKGAVLAKWNKNWIENTFNYTNEQNPGMWQTYHADLTLQEQGGNANASPIWGTYYWDVQGHNCQYHESPNSQGFVVCHPLDVQEAMNGEPGGYAWMYLNGAPDNPPTERRLLKGEVHAPPTPGRGGAGASAAGGATGRAGTSVPGAQ